MNGYQKPLLHNLILVSLLNFRGEKQRVDLTLSVVEKLGLAYVPQLQPTRWSGHRVAIRRYQAAILGCAGQSLPVSGRWCRSNGLFFRPSILGQFE